MEVVKGGRLIVALKSAGSGGKGERLVVALEGADGGSSGWRGGSTQRRGWW